MPLFNELCCPGVSTPPDPPPGCCWLPLHNTVTVFGCLLHQPQILLSHTHKSMAPPPPPSSISQAETMEGKMARWRLQNDRKDVQRGGGREHSATCRQSQNSSLHQHQHKPETTCSPPILLLQAQRNPFLSPPHTHTHTQTHSHTHRVKINTNLLSP